ncbi:IS630 family transposase [Larkinella punicea]|uniref:IS630 family transposase n=1 Tax=Larkinella punicea TaxID=2315727 RepID=UPI001E4CAF77|nr:IS630 family transposase [Larkinella punicea]
MILYIDEAACYLLPLLAHTWAPRGHTPVVKEQAGREHWNLIAAIAPNGRIYVGYQNQAYTGEDLVWFLEKRCNRYRKRDLLVIWDGLKAHSSEAIKAFLAARPGRVHLERLPAYSPELNPVELVWSHLKRSLKNQVFTSLTALREAIRQQVKLLEKGSDLVCSFFRKKEVAFMTD